MKACVMCAATATHFCPQDDAFLCKSCNTTIHSANVLASRHKVLTVQEYLQQGFNKTAADAQSEASASPAAAPLVKEETYDLSPPVSTTGTEGVVPVMAPAISSMFVGPSPASAPDGSNQPKWTSDFDMFDLDNGWLEKLDCGFDLGSMFDEAHLVPDFVPDAPAPAINDAVNDPREVPYFPAAEAGSPSLGFDLLSATEVAAESFPERQAKRARVQQDTSEDLDILVPDRFGIPTFDMPSMADDAFDFGLPTPLFESSSTAATPVAAPASAVPPVSPAVQAPGPVVKVSAEQAAINRAERLNLYREKKKNRKFEKTIRYASRKAYAEVRPRIKGRFATPAEVAAMKAAAAVQAAVEEDAVVPCM